MTERADTARFLASLPELRVDGEAYFQDKEPIVVSRAPGRLDVMGGIADYSGSLVLQMPLALATFVAVQQREGGDIEIVSCGPDEATTRRFRAPVAVCLGEAGGAAACARAACAAEDRWAGYVLGTLAVLMDQGVLSRTGGLRIAVRSDVPEGKGVSSSAALEVATMSAVAELFAVELAPAELALACQRVEHEVCGAPCGIMDQMAVTLGREDHLLALHCQPAEVLDHLALPADAAVWGVDSGVRHEVAGEDYGSVRTAAFMGLRILAHAVHLDVREVAPGRVEIEDPHWRGYLANVTAEELAGELYPFLPASLRGDEFLMRYGGITDDVTTVEPARRYRVRAATCHPIRESTRIRQFANALTEGPDEAQLRMMGAWMGLSHAGYGDCGLGTPVTDRIVDLVRVLGPARGLYGARITGGGSGGTVAILGHADAGDAIEELVTTLGAETGRAHTVFSGSSPGAHAHGTRRLAPGAGS